MAQRAVAHSRAITPKSMTDDQPGIPLDSPLFSLSRRRSCVGWPAIRLSWLCATKNKSKETSGR